MPSQRQASSQQPTSSQRPTSSRHSAVRSQTQITPSANRSRDANGPDNQLVHEDLAKEIAQFALYATSHRGHYADTDIKKIAQVRNEEFKLASLDATKRMKNVLSTAIITDMQKHRSILASTNTRLYLESELPNDPKEEAKKGLLLILLMFINMSQNPKCQLKDGPSGVRMDAVWAFLEELGYKEGEPDADLGDLSKLIGPINTAEFIKKDWLQAKKHTDANDMEYFYLSWGKRAELYVDQPQLLQLYCKMMGENPQNYPSYIEKANRANKTRRQIFEGK